MPNVWDKDIPVEKSAYLKDKDIEYFNVNSFKIYKGKPTMIDLFCGAGGFSVGCQWAGFQTVFGIDHLEPAMKTWVRNHPRSIGCLGDITKVSPKEVRELLESKGVKHIALITGGVPCQGFSIANRKHNDYDERNFLFLEYMKYVKEFSPDYIILENVSGMRSTAGGKFENDIKKYMDSLGYETVVKLINAADYGVPQVRQRLVFVGVKRNQGFPSPYVFPEGEFRDNHRTVRDAISDLPELGNNEEKNSYELEPQSEYQAIMRGCGSIKGIKSLSRLYNHIAPNHPEETIEKIRKTKPGRPMYEKFKQRIRLSNDLPSPTQLAGGIRPQFQFGHPTQSRGLTIRERARIQSFPDDYIFEGGIVQERVQTGNAVPPLMIYNLAIQIAAQLKRKGREK